MEEEIQYKIPLGVCKQACMKLNSFITDIHEMSEDPDVDPEDKETFIQIAEVAGIMMANIVNIVSKECGEEEFLNEDIPLDEIDIYPGDEDDIIDETIED